ncbi:MAG: hypothetical protein WC462_01660 [archaeon]
MVFSLIAKIPKTVKGLFKKEHAVIRIRIEDVPLLIEKEFILKKRELENFSGKKISEVKYLHSKSTNLLKVISGKELQGKENERFNKAALTSKKQLETQLKRLIEKLDPKDKGKTLDEARQYSGESYSILTGEIIAFRKNIIYTSFYFKEEMKELGETLQEILNIFNEMNKTFSKEKELFEFEKIKEKVGLAIKKKKDYLVLENQEKELINKLTEKEKRILEQKERVLQKKTGKEMVEIKHLEEEITNLMNKKQEVKTEISALLLNIDRPLQRFKQLVDSGRWKISREEKEMLEQFLVNPIIALKKDPKAELFKKVLVEIKKAIEDNMVELKDKEREKRLEALQEIINFDFFGKVFWKMNEIQKKQTEINKELEKNVAKKDLEKEEIKLKEFEHELDKAKEEIEGIQKSKSIIKIEIEKDFSKIKEFTEKCLGKTVLFEEEAY